MKKISLTPRAIVGYMANKTGLGNFEISRRLGKAPTFLNGYTNRGSLPSASMLASIAKVCGYEVHIIGHDEDIRIEVVDD